MTNREAHQAVFGEERPARFGNGGRRKRARGGRAELHMLSPEQDEAIIREAGFSRVSLFYVAFTWRGWVATA